MKVATKAMAHEIADEMLTASHGVNIKKKMKHSIFEIAKKLAKKIVRNNKRVMKAETVANTRENHRPAPKPMTENRTKPKGLKI